MSTRPPLVNDDLELNQILYDFGTLLEELELSRKHLEGYLSCLEPDEFLWSPDRAKVFCVTQQLGQLAYRQKEWGKNCDMHFAFKLDDYDDIFSLTNPSRDVYRNLPAKEEVLDYYHEVHRDFLGECKYVRKAELVYSLVNLTYQHMKDIRRLVLELGYKDPSPAALSQRVSARYEGLGTVQYYLPVYAN